jgi:ribonuclease HI
MLPVKHPPAASPRRPAPGTLIDALRPKRTGAMGAKHTVHVHADESCLGNQFSSRANPGGAGALVEVWRKGAWERRDLWVSDPDTTNQRMAIRSAIEVLRALRKPCTVLLWSDSQYLVKGISEWLPGWKQRGWRRKGGPIENLELWQSLDALLARHDVRPEWVRGHAGHPRNEYANHLATRAAKERSTSGGLVPSAFETWLEGQRGKGRYVDYQEFLPPTPPTATG